VTEADAHSGRRCFFLRGVGPARDTSVPIEPSPALEAGASYVLDAWVKVIGADASALLRAEPAEWVPEGVAVAEQASMPVPAGQGWQRVRLDFRNGPHGSTARLALAVLGDGVAYFDDVTLKRADGAAPAK
jgi:hypothetical protein